MITGRFADPQFPGRRLYGNVLSTHRDQHFVQVTKINARVLEEPFNVAVRTQDFIANQGANKGYWREQLRGKDGQWIEMGGGIEWLDAQGTRRLGTVTGFDDEIERVIVTDSEGNEYKLSADEIKSSATKAILDPTPSDTTLPSNPEDPDEIDFDSIEAFLDGDNVEFPDFFSDPEKFPIGGPPLEIKDKQGRSVARVYKQEPKEGDGPFSLLFDILVAVLPADFFHIWRALNKNK